jgi:hypothetical protein
MPKRLSDVERLEAYFLTAPVEQCVLQRDRIDLILRARGGAPVPPVRGRKPKVKAAPPIANTIRQIACNRCAGEGKQDGLTCPRCKGTGQEP